MAVELEGLEFQIESNIDGATKGIDSLAESLTKLKTAVKGNGLKTLGKNLEALTKIKVDASSVDGIKKLADAVNSFSTAKLSSGIAKNIESITQAVKGMDDSDISRLNELGDALKKMDGITIPNIKSAMDAVKKSKSQQNMQLPAVLNEGSTDLAPIQGTNFADSFVSGSDIIDVAFKEIESDSTEVGSRIETLATKFMNWKAALGTVGGAVKKLGLNGLKAGLSGVSSAVKLAGKGFKSLAGSQISKAKEGFKSLSKAGSSLLSSLSRIAMYRAIRFFFSQLTSAMKEGINNLYQYSTLMGGTFKSSMDSLATSFTYLKNSLGAMAAPIINAIAPAVDALIDKFVTLLNVVNQFFARLSGASTYTKASKAAQSYGDSISSAGSSAKKAAKDIKDATTGIDELNIISQNDNSSSGSGSGGSNYGDMFETVPIDSTISDFTDKLKAAFEAGDWTELGTLLGEKFNEIVDSIDWTGFGSKVGYGINGAVQTAYAFLKVADFKNLGNHVAEFLNAALGEIDFNTVGRLWVRSMTAMLDFFIGLLGGLDWALIGKSISDFLIGALDEASEWIMSYDWGEVADGIYDNLKICLGNIDWAGIAQSFFYALGAAFGAAAKVLVTWIKDIGEDIVGYFKQYIKIDPNDSWVEQGVNIVQGIFNGIIDALKNIGQWIVTNIFDPFINGFKDAFGIHSPSTVMKEMGKYIVEGFLEGLNLFSTIASKVKQWSSTIVEWFKKGEDGKGIVEHFKEFGSNVVSGFREKVGNTYSTVKSNITTWADKVKEWFTSDSAGGANNSTFQKYAGDVIEGFKTKVGNTYTDTKSNITTWANNVKEWFTNSSYGGVNATNFQTFANNSIEGFKQKVGSAYTNTRSNVVTWATNVKNWFTNSSYGGVNSTNFQTFANNAVEGFRTKVGTAYTNTKSNMITWATNVKNWFTGGGFGGVNATSFQTFANNVVTGFREKIGSAYTSTKSNMTTWATNVKNWFSGIANSTAFSGFATSVVDGFKNRVSNYYSTATSVIKTWGNAVVSAFQTPDGTSLVSHFTNIGENIVNGFIKGVNNLWDTAVRKIREFGESIVSAGKEGTEEASPSKAFKRIGAYVIEGFNIGVDNMIPESFKVMDNWLSGINTYQPQVALAVDTSALRYYDSAAFSKSVDTNIQSQTEITATGFTDAMETFYHEYVEPTFTQMAEDMRRQADKNEQTVVQVGNRVVTDAVTIQRKANGYSFT